MDPCPLKYFDGHLRETARALDAGDEAGVRRWLDLGAIDLHERGREEMTLLWYAMLKENHHGIRLLIQLGSAPDGQKLADLSPLDAAIRFDKPDLLRAMLDGGLSPNHWPKNGQPLLQRTILATDDVSKVRLLVERGADVNAVNPNSDNTTPLHAAVFQQLTEIAAYLVRQGANSNAQTSQGVSAAWAVYRLLQSDEPEHAASKSGFELVRQLMVMLGVAWPPALPVNARQWLEAQGMESTT